VSTVASSTFLCLPSKFRQRTGRSWLHGLVVFCRIGIWVNKSKPLMNNHVLGTGGVPRRTWQAFRSVHTGRKDLSSNYAITANSVCARAFVALPVEVVSSIDMFMPRNTVSTVVDPIVMETGRRAEANAVGFISMMTRRLSSRATYLEQHREKQAVLFSFPQNTAICSRIQNQSPSNHDADTTTTISSIHHDGFRRFHSSYFLHTREHSS